MIEVKARRAVGVPTETILFNIDSKGPSNKDKTAILRIFARVFFEHLGDYGEDLKLRAPRTRHRPERQNRGVPRRVPPDHGHRMARRARRL